MFIPFRQGRDNRASIDRLNGCWAVNRVDRKETCSFVEFYDKVEQETFDSWVFAFTCFGASFG